MEVIICRDADAAANLTADLIESALQIKPNMTLGLATGRTMENLYGKLVQKHKDQLLDFSLAVTFNLDEYIGLAPEDPNSYRTYMNHFLFDKINIDKRNTFLPNGTADDLDAECAEYEAKILDYGGIDLQLLGIGCTGHIGFNEPLSAIHSRTRCKALTPGTIAQNAPLFDDPSMMPRRAITMGVGTILEAKRCLLLATGEEKAEIIAKAVEGPMTAMISATAMQWHAKCTVILDEAAATCLEQTEYYHWIFQNEPEWEPYREKYLP